MASESSSDAATPARDVGPTGPFDEGEEIRIFLPIAKVHVAGKAWGPLNGDPVLCLHGWLDNCNSFLPLVTLLRRMCTRSLRIVAVDFPGHGAAEEHRFAVGECLLALLSTKTSRVVPSLEEAARAWMSKNPTLTLESAMLLMQRGTRAVPGGYQFRHDMQLRATSIAMWEELAIRDAFTSIKCPVLVVTPELGLILQSPMHLRLHYVPHWRVLKCDGGHHVHMDHPERVAEPIAAFLDEEDESEPADAAAAPKARL